MGGRPAPGGGTARQGRGGFARPGNREMAAGENERLKFFPDDNCISTFLRAAPMNLADHPTVQKWHATHGDSPSAAPTPGPLDAAWLKRLCLENGADDAGVV